MQVVRNVGEKFAAAKYLHDCGAKSQWFLNADGRWELDLSSMSPQHAMLAVLALA